LRLRRAFPGIHRPYLSPMGTAGAISTLGISIVTLATLFLNRDYRPGVIGAAVWFLAGIVYFQLHGRKNLVLAPEEEFARSASGKAIPERP
jgi:ethanolamine permease